MEAVWGVFHGPRRGRAQRVIAAGTDARPRVTGGAREPMTALAAATVGRRPRSGVTPGPARRHRRA
ncbi:hypothetical protein FRACA_150041 [Frankia canadensis]|uniref:Uncharacterized protein n=1 Tax=Frankia canadensis TaxID=1836972 RepID=A0A2I2KLY8_9ACTN|nr:hypothetical protein FRACA_150041 [Frankia canadensis]SOU53959.1 hypothetical protein FRACA_150041 [Frankia canadensis]